MKISILVIALVCLPVLFGIAQNNIASIKFNKTSHDFGDIKEVEGNVEHTFEFTNDGTAVLVIQSVKASCGCTTPEWSSEPIKPGEKGFITAVFDPNKRPGAFNKSLTVISNANSQPLKIYIKGNVESIPRPPEELYPTVMGGLRFRYKTISFEAVTKEKPVTKIINVYNKHYGDITFSDAYEAPDHIKLKFSPQTLPSKAVGTIEISYDPRGIELLGHKADLIEIKTDEWFNSVKKLRIIASLEEYFPPMTPEQLGEAPRLKIENSVYDFGTIREGETVTTDFVITNTGKRDLNIRQTRATCGCTASKPEKSDLKPGESSIIKVTFDSSGRSGDQNKFVLVYSNDPSNPTQKIEIKGVIAEDAGDS
jgi:hypothetical protein